MSRCGCCIGNDPTCEKVANCERGREPDESWCPSCDRCKPGWPQDWRNKPDATNPNNRLRYVCRECSEARP
jgi:hypothetical protein